MGDQTVKLVSNKAEEKEFMQQLLRDIRALEKMLEDGLIESGITRIGAEQELCFVNKSFRPSPIAMDFLKLVNDPHFTTEYASFNAEINLDPMEFKDSCLSDLHKKLDLYLNKARKAALDLDSYVLLVGILPTLRSTDLDKSNQTPLPRYELLTRVLTELRGGTFEFHISGTDELITKHDNSLFEACNTSYQLHMQVDPDEFAARYNWAQAISGPLLATCTNSPLFLGKRLWRETRIALFQQSIDIRKSDEYLRERTSRVNFGNQWIKNSIIEIYQEDIARFRSLITTTQSEDALEELKNGQTPKLNALKIHNGTIYKWNRACYGILDGVPHIRIENRIMPSGPTTIDQVASSAFWLGMMAGMPEEYARIHKKMEFDDAKTNFVRAARQGLGAQFIWMNGKQVASQKLILSELIPIAHEGLTKMRIKKEDIEYYMGILEERVHSGRTGSQWMLDTFGDLRKEGTRYEATVATTAGMYHRQKTGRPVHTWDKARMDEAGSWRNRYWRIEQIMATDLFTVQEDDLMDLVTNIMDWRKIRHVPVEDKSGKLVGLITSGILVHHYATKIRDDSDVLAVKDIMVKELITVTPKTKTTDALAMMKDYNIGCLPVVKSGKLVGIVTEHDFVAISNHLLLELTDCIELDDE